jgi:hypothetical protein
LNEEDSESDEEKSKPKSLVPFAKIMQNAARNKLMDKLTGGKQHVAPVRLSSSLKKPLTEKQQLAELDDLLGSDSHDSISNSSCSSSSSESLNLSDF